MNVRELIAALVECGDLDTEVKMVMAGIELSINHIYTAQDKFGEYDDAILLYCTRPESEDVVNIIANERSREPNP